MRPTDERASHNQALVTEVARGMLNRVAAVEPAQVAAERRAFDALLEAYFANPGRALDGGDRGSGKLALGLPGVEELLTPVLLAAAAEVVRYVADCSAAATATAVRRVLGLTPAQPGAVEAPPAGGDRTVAPLTTDQWAEVRGIVRQALIRHGRMAPERADLIAAAVVVDGLTGHDDATGE